MNSLQSIAQTILGEIEAARQRRPWVLIAIDGRSASGKTTLAGLLKEGCGCNVLHMDSFFLRPEQRTPQRLSEPGSNVDLERFQEEALLPLVRGEPFSYRPFDCKTGELAAPIQVPTHPVTVVEGAYSCHPLLFDSYDLTVFLNVGSAEQARRILARNGEAAARVFAEKWIPLEERYFAAYNIQKRCALAFGTGNLSY